MDKARQIEGQTVQDGKNKPQCSKEDLRYFAKPT